MADTVTTTIESGTPEAVAFELFKWMRNVEDDAKRKLLLDRYAECLRATRGLPQTKP